jgi:hypothetical protein
VGSIKELIRYFRGVCPYLLNHRLFPAKERLDLTTAFTGLFPNPLIYNPRVGAGIEAEGDDPNPSS